MPSNSLPPASILSSMPSMISTIRVSRRLRLRAEKAGMSNLRILAWRSPSIWVMNCTHELVELLEAVASRQLRRKPLGIGKNLVHVRVATADDLGRAGGKDVERRSFGPFRENGARVLFELAAADVDVNDFASVEFTQRRHDASVNPVDEGPAPSRCGGPLWFAVGLVLMRIVGYWQGVGLRSSWGMPGSRQIASPGFSCVSRTWPSSNVISFLPSVSGTMRYGSRCWCHG